MFEYSYSPSLSQTLISWSVTTTPDTLSIILWDQILYTPMKYETPLAIEFNLSDTQRKSWMVALMNSNSLAVISRGLKIMIHKRYLNNDDTPEINNESLKYFLHATSRLNSEGMLKRGMIWPYVGLWKLWDLQIWGKVENIFWEILILLLTFGTGGQRQCEDRGRMEPQLPPSSSQGTTGEEE